MSEVNTAALEAGSRVQPEGEGGTTAAEAAEVTQRHERRLCLIGVDWGCLLLPEAVTGFGVSGGVSSVVDGLQVFMGRGVGVADRVASGVTGFGVADSLGVGGGVGVGVFSGVGSGGD